MQSRRDDSRITEQATDWLGTLKEGGLQEREAFAAWLRESPRHVGEFLLVSAISREFDGMDPDHALSVEQSPAGLAPNVIELQANPPRRDVARNSRRRWFVAGAAAALAACAITAGWLLVSGAGWKKYTTDSGEQRIFELADGSMIHLNTHSQVNVRLSEQGRDIRLVAGEALFKVARDPGRPFRVYSGDTVIQAVGTEFNVYRRPRGTTVAVIEGLVQVSTADRSRAAAADHATPSAEPAAAGPARLAAGQRVNVTPNGRIEPLPAMDAVNVSAWRQHRLVFLEDRLGDVAAEFNRYNRTPQIRIVGDSVIERQLTGVFDANDPQSLVQFLSGVKELAVDRDADGTIVIRGK